ncbi:MAG: DUF1257 domain-containing protein [Candidatus Bathyarchaeia archaeon]
MSHYLNLQTNITDQEALVRALVRLGGVRTSWTRDRVESYNTAESLFGYKGDRRPQRAHVIIRRRHVGPAANDIGFERQADGTFHAHISEFDTSQGYNRDWLNKLTAYYGVEKAKMELDAKGLKYVESVDKTNNNCPRLEVFFEAPKAKAKVSTFFG